MQTLPKRAWLHDAPFHRRAPAVTHREYPPASQSPMHTRALAAMRMQWEEDAQTWQSAKQSGKVPSQQSPGKQSRKTSTTQPNKQMNHHLEQAPTVSQQALMQLPQLQRASISTSHHQSDAQQGRTAHQQHVEPHTKQHATQTAALELIKGSAGEQQGFDASQCPSHVRMQEPAGDEEVDEVVLVVGHTTKHSDLCEAAPTVQEVAGAEGAALAGAVQQPSESATCCASGRIPPRSFEVVSTGRGDRGSGQAQEHGPCQTAGRPAGPDPRLDSEQMDEGHRPGSVAGQGSWQRMTIGSVDDRAPGFQGSVHRRKAADSEGSTGAAAAPGCAAAMRPTTLGVSPEGGVVVVARPLAVAEQRVSNLVQALLCGACLGATHAVRQVPTAVVWAYFAFMALTSLPGAWSDHALCVLCVWCGCWSLYVIPDADVVACFAVGMI